TCLVVAGFTLVYVKTTLALDWIFIMLIILVGIALLLLAWAKFRRDSVVDLTYVRARSFDKKARFCLLFAAGFLTVGLAPIVPYQLAKQFDTGVSGIGGLAMLASGIAAVVQIYFTLIRNNFGGRIARFLVPIGVISFLISVLSLAYWLAIVWHAPE